MSLTGDRAQWIAERMQLSREEAVVAGEVMDEAAILDLWERRWAARHPREDWILKHMKLMKGLAEQVGDEWDEAEEEEWGTSLYDFKLRHGQIADPEPDMDAC